MKGRPLTLMVFILAILIVKGCSKSTSEGIPLWMLRGNIPPNTRANSRSLLNPLASFNYSAILDNFHAPAGFEFRSSSSHADTIWWNFGDGSPLDFSANPSHVYPTAGSYLVTLTAKSGWKISTDSQRIAVLNPLYTRLIVDSIRAQVFANANKVDTVFFSISDSAGAWQSEKFVVPVTVNPYHIGLPSAIIQSFLFQHPDTISNFKNIFSINVADNNVRPKYGEAEDHGPYKYVGAAQAYPAAGNPYSIILSEAISSFSLIGYPSVLQNQNPQAGTGVEFTVYITWN